MGRAAENTLAQVTDALTVVKPVITPDAATLVSTFWLAARHRA